MKKGHRLLAMVLAVYMCLGMMPRIVLADAVVPYSVFRCTSDLSCEEFIDLMNKQLKPENFNSLGWNAVYSPSDGLNEKQKNEIKGVVTSITQGCSTDYDKAFAIYDWVVRNIAYDLYPGDWPEIEKPCRIYWTFKNKRGVCGNIANLLNAMMQLAGIPSITIEGTSNYDSTGPDHKWNAIYVNGSWKMIDATHDCPNFYYGPDSPENVFNEEPIYYMFYNMDAFYDRKFLSANWFDYSAEKFNQPGVFSYEKDGEYFDTDYKIYINGERYYNKSFYPYYYHYDENEFKASIEIYVGDSKLKYGEDYVVGKNAAIKGHASYEVVIYGNTQYDMLSFTFEGHKWNDDDGTIIYEPTSENTGEIQFTCDECGKVLTKVIPEVAKKSIKNAKVVLSKKAFTYNGKVHKPAIKTIGGKSLKSGKDYITKWSNVSSKKAGSYTVTITGKGKYTGKTKATYKIKKAANLLKVKGKTATVKYSRLKNKKQTLKVSKVIKIIKKGQGNVTYAKSSGNKKITINKKTGKITIKKGIKKGTYKIKVKVTAAGNKNYKKGSKTVTVKVTVK